MLIDEEARVGVNFRLMDIDLAECPCCGGELHVIGETVSEMLDHVPARLRVARSGFTCQPN
jgi:transposase